MELQQFYTEPSTPFKIKSKFSNQTKNANKNRLPGIKKDKIKNKNVKRNNQKGKKFCPKNVYKKNI